jgi:hypothetical protein
MGHTKAYLKRKALNKIASHKAAEKRRKKAVGDQHGQSQQDDTADAQQAVSAEGAEVEEVPAGAEDDQQLNEGQLHRLASVAAAAAAAADATRAIVAEEEVVYHDASELQLLQAGPTKAAEKVSIAWALFTFAFYVYVLAAANSR